MSDHMNDRWAQLYTVTQKLLTYILLKKKIKILFKYHVYT